MPLGLYCCREDIDLNSAVLCFISVYVIGVGLSAISLMTPHWYDFTIVADGSSGLWAWCYDGICHRIKDSDLPLKGVFYATCFFAVTSVALSLVVFFLLSVKMRSRGDNAQEVFESFVRSSRASGWVALVQAIFYAIALLIFVVAKETHDEHVSSSYGYSFYVGWAAVVYFVFMAISFNINHHSDYESLA